ncbi:MAG: GAF domain-containing protein [Alphaproteobacteria bacterium]|nr:GAF domain-containing protein [Alphaproteobacteria bacterium]MBT5860028.1 GAF domain-containing protein [Alphaproteobacteria bacterium]
MPELLNAHFRKVFEGTLKEAALEQIRALILETKSPEVADEVAHLLHQYSALLDVAQRFASETSLDILLPQVIRVVTAALGAEVATLFLYDPDTDELWSRIARGVGVDEIRIPADVGIVGSVFKSGEHLNIPDAYADQRFNPAVDIETGFKTRTIVCVPLRNREGNVIGATQVLNKRSGSGDGQFNDADIALLSTITTHAAGALEVAQLVQRAELARAEESRMTEIMTAISSEISLDAVLEKIANGATQLLGAERSTIFLYDSVADELWSLVAEGAGTKEIRISATTGIAGAVIHGDDVLIVHDAYADPRFNQDVDKDSGFTTRSILCVRIVNNHGEIVGVMQVLNSTHGPFVDEDARRLRAFAAQAAAALENAELFDEVLRLKNYNEGILKSLSNGVVTFDVDTVVTKFNDAAARILGVEGAELNGSTAGAVFAKDNGWVVKSLDYVATSGRDDFHADVDLVQLGGEIVSVNLTAAPLTSVDGEPMGSTLVIDDISREKRVRSTMARYMAKEVLEKVLEAGEGALEATTHEATVLFSDIRGFTSIAEMLGSHKTVAMLNDYFSDMVEVIFNHAGVLDKYIGDAIMAVFGAPVTNPYDADNALIVATEMMAALRDFNQRDAAGPTPISIRIGLSTGEVVAGTIGSARRMEYTVIGDTVNMAARLEAANKFYGTDLLLSSWTVDQLSSRDGLRQIDMLRVKGIVKPVTIFESLRHAPDHVREQLEQVVGFYSEGVNAYRHQDWGNAIAGFQKALSERPEDGPSSFYIDRCKFYMKTPPPNDWDGVWTDRRK